MNYFIDFDHTLYNTPLLTEEMLSSLAKYICKTSGKNYDEILSTLTLKFKRGDNNIYDIYDLITYFSKIYHYDENIAQNIINNVIFNGKKFLYNDSITFLEYLKKQGNKINILSYNESKLYFQTVKIAGSGILAYADSLATTLTLKGDLPLDFSKCIFIDDKPKDLISINNKKPFKIYRIRRPNDTYSNENINNNSIIEFSSLAELQLALDKEKIYK